jgi:protease-4
MRYLSFGLIGNIPTSGFAEGVIDLAIRPLGNEKVAVFGDYVFRKDRNPNDIKWSAGVAFEPIDGIRLTGRYFDTEIFNVGVQLSFGNFGLTTQSHFDEDGDQQFNTYGIKVGAYDRNPFTGLSEGKDYAKINLYGGVKYQRFRLFDNSKTLMDLLTQIDAAKNDESVSGIAINTSGMNINRELIWEIREKIVEFKKIGKNVVVFIDRAGMDEFHLASVADKIMIDPLGTLYLDGYLWGRQYYKGTLEKLGIGFHELRYFKYKSAAETFANDKMSEADKEQLQLLVDGWYERARKDICQGRDLSFEEFDNLVDNEGIILPEDALKMGLVDTIARWNSVNDFIEKIEGEKKGFVNPGSLAVFRLPEDNYWGKKPEIAVIYAIGVCDMEEGIKARTLVDDVRSAVENDDVKAIVLRVDSPGGDALASDYIAAALKEGKGKKPIIVSQGFVAASGGYWLSMYADTIIAAPTTITGSIGVIGAFFYNQSFKEEFGVSTDYVKRGKHADLGYGMRLPLFGITLPDRDFTEEELQKAESTIKILYKDFVGKVAVGRDMQYDDIEKVAQGRVWTGEDGKERGLVDVLGGLSTAINMVEDLSGLKDNEYELVEYPTPGWFDFASLMPGFLGIEEQIFQDDKFIEELKFRLENNGYPMPILPMSDMDLLMK